MFPEADPWQAPPVHSPHEAPSPADAAPDVAMGDGDTFATVTDPLFHLDTLLFPSLERVMDCRVNSHGVLEYLCAWSPGRAPKRVVDPPHPRYDAIVLDYKLLYVRQGRARCPQAPPWCLHGRQERQAVPRRMGPSLVCRLLKARGATGCRRLSKDLLPRAAATPWTQTSGASPLVSRRLVCSTY